MSRVSLLFLLGPEQMMDGIDLDVLEFATKLLLMIMWSCLSNSVKKNPLGLLDHNPVFLLEETYACTGSECDGCA